MDWELFNNELEAHIQFRNELLETHGFLIAYRYINSEKAALIDIEKYLYQAKRNNTLSPKQLKSIRKTMKAHWENVKEIEHTLRTYAGLVPEEVVEPPENMKLRTWNTYKSKIWELHKMYHETILKLVKKEDTEFYDFFHSDNESYTEFILKYVEDYLQQSKETAETYSGLLKTAYETNAKIDKDPIRKLNQMYLNLNEMHQAVQQNFSVEGGFSQKTLMEKMNERYHEQSWLSANSFIENLSTLWIRGQYKRSDCYFTRL